MGLEDMKKEVIIYFHYFSPVFRLIGDDDRVNTLD
jgi:hypothetical protein